MQKSKGGLGRGLGALLPSQPSPTSSDREQFSPVKVPSILQFTTAKASATEKNVSKSPSSAPKGDTVRLVDPLDIVANPRQPRHHFSPDDLSDLIASVKEHGILQPLVVTEAGDGKYELIAGERRLRSAREAGLDAVPVLIRVATDQQKLELALIENIQRADLNAVEEARAYRQLMEDFGLTQEDVAGRVGKSRSQIANTVRLLELSADMLAAVIEGRITKSHARTLLSESNEGRRRALFERMLSGGVTVRKAENAVSRTHKKEKDPNVLALEETLREKLGTKVTIDERGAEHVIAIHCYAKEDLADMIRRLQEV